MLIKELQPVFSNKKEAAGLNCHRYEIDHVYWSAFNEP